MDDLTHGTTSCYKNRGCRCNACTAANTESARLYRERKAANTVCSTEGCLNGVYCKGLCGYCYRASRMISDSLHTTKFADAAPHVKEQLTREYAEKGMTIEQAMQQGLLE